jgi:hypothetical protein
MDEEGWDNPINAAVELLVEFLEGKKVVTGKLFSNDEYITVYT